MSDYDEPTQEEIDEVAATIGILLDAIGDGRDLSAFDREEICKRAVKATADDPDLNLYDAFDRAFRSYRDAVTEPWTADYNFMKNTPERPHSWREDLVARRQLVGSEEDVAYGQADSLSDAGEVTVMRLRAARRLDEGQAPHIGIDSAREAALDAAREVAFQEAREREGT
jgi:hypothetical protein